MSNILTNNINPRSGNKITIGGVNDTVSIAGTITYEDVTSVDSIGIITARQGVVIGTGASIGNPANNELGLYTNSSERVRIDNSGNIGIGTDNPNHKLTLFQSGTDTFDAINVVTGNTNSTGYQMGVNSSGEVFHWNTTNSSINFATNNTERFRITSDGNGSYLRLNHNTTAGSIGLGDTLGTISFTDSNGGIFSQIKGENDGTESNLDYPGRISFWTTADNASSSTERMRIDRDGKVHIGNDLGDRQAELLQVIRNGGGQGTNDCLVWFETGQNDWTLQLNHTELASGNAYFINCLQQGTQRGRAWFDGSNMHWATSSDYRLKENVTPVTNGISEVKRLNPVNYRFIENPTVRQVGFLAHELDEVCPYAVSGEKDAVNDDGSINPQMVDKSHVVPILAAGLKEAIAKIETLEAKVAALEGN